MAEVLRQHPDADLLNLSEEQRLLVVEEFLSLDIFNRLVLDIGNAIRTHASTAAVYVRRLDEVRRYIAETVKAAFRQIRGQGRKPIRGDIAAISRNAITSAIDVFEEYAT